MSEIQLRVAITTDIKGAIEKAQKTLVEGNEEWCVLCLNGHGFDVHRNSNIKDLVTIYYLKQEIETLKNCHDR
jgi:hypothetical protein